MKAEIKMIIKNCYECPFREKIYIPNEYWGYDCKAIGEPYSTTPEKGIREDCPFRK